MTAPVRILQLAHGHPDFGPGGTEAVALALHRTALADGKDSWFLGAADASRRPPNPGASIIGLTDDQREAVLWVPAFDRFRLSQPDSWGALAEFADYLDLIRPDVIHIHHVLDLGLEAIAIARVRLPTARIVLTLHDYHFICAAHGQLYRHDLDARCPGPSLSRCLACIPGSAPSDFALRRRDIAHAVSMVDVVTAPSDFLRRAVAETEDWGHRIEVLPNAHVGGPERAPIRLREKDRPVIFGYFGNLARVKGIPELLHAARLLLARGVGDFRIHVHGAQRFEDDRVADALAATRDALGHRLLLAGSYRPEDMPALMADIDAVVIPSVWCENAPLTALEAIHHGRPVIAFPHGAIPELLARHHTGHLATRSDPAALADAMEAWMRSGEGEEKGEGKGEGEGQFTGVPIHASNRDEMLDNFQSLYRPQNRGLR